MGTTTFSGPVKAGTIKDTTGSSIGTNVANTGFVIMAQSSVVDIAGVTATTSVGVIPANSKISEVILNVVQASDSSAAATLSVGFSTGDATLLDSTSVKAVGVTFSSAMGTASINIGTADQEVFATYSPVSATATLKGIGDVTVKYLQNSNLSIS
jgi:hypothetical protein